MPGKVIHVPPGRHHCDPTREAPHGAVPGTRWQCDCGKTWIAFHPQPRGGQHIVGGHWRRESWLELAARKTRQTLTRREAG